jgi:hypothetical protein
MQTVMKFPPRGVKQIPRTNPLLMRKSPHLRPVMDRFINAFISGEIPHSNFAITGTRQQNTQASWVLGKRMDAIHVAYSREKNQQ